MSRPCERRDPSPLASKVKKVLCSSAETTVRAVWVPAFALGHLHIWRAIYEELEACHSDVEGDWSRWAMRGVAGPSAELCDDPSRPGDGVGAMMVLLELSPAFQGFVDCLERFDLVRRKDKFVRELFAAIAGLNELDDDTGHSGGDRHQFDQAFSAVELTVLDAQALALQRAKELFDDPALLVPGDDPPGIGGGGNRMSGQEQP